MKPRALPVSQHEAAAFHDGRQTMFRRVMKPQPVHEGRFWRWHGAGWSDGIQEIWPVPGHSMNTNCPYPVGRRLWVQEAFCDIFRRTEHSPGCVYKCDFGSRIDLPRHWDPPGGAWTQATHMPRWASRTLLEVTAVKAEPVATISEQDAWAHGIRREDVGCINHEGRPRLCRCREPALYPIPNFERLWDEASPAHLYKSNLWVWAATVRKVEA